MQRLQHQPLFFLSVNYYSSELLRQLVMSLGQNYEIVIVNNSPSDDKIHRLAESIREQRDDGKRITVLEAASNDGFGSGCNIGLQWIYTRSPQALVWLINPDAQLFPAAISTIYKGFECRPNIAILGTPILDTKGSLWFGAGQFNRWTGAVTSEPTKSTGSLGVQSTEIAPIATEWVSGCSMVLNLKVLNHCPQFDEAYFLYYEDCDLCDRYRQQGYQIAITQQPLVTHAVSSITSRHTQTKYHHATFSKLAFLHRRATSLALGLNLLYLLAQSVLLRSTSMDAARGRWSGFKQFLHYLKLNPPKPHPPKPYPPKADTSSTTLPHSNNIHAR